MDSLKSIFEKRSLNNCDSMQLQKLKAFQMHIHRSEHRAAALKFTVLL